MRILTYDELAPEMDPDRALIHLSAFGGVYPSRAVGLRRRRLKILPDYVGVFAVEAGRILGQVFVDRLPYAFRDGPGTISGIAAVGTRPDKGRAGIARLLLTEVHRREREAGIDFAALWTNRSWGAHSLYERLGYRDVYSSPWALHGPVGRRGARGRPKGIRQVESATSRTSMSFMIASVKAGSASTAGRGASGELRFHSVTSIRARI